MIVMSPLRVQRGRNQTIVFKTRKRGLLRTPSDQYKFQVTDPISGAVLIAKTNGSGISIGDNGTGKIEIDSSEMQLTAATYEYEMAVLTVDTNDFITLAYGDFLVSNTRITTIP